MRAALHIAMRNFVLIFIVMFVLGPTSSRAWAESYIGIGLGARGQLDGKIAEHFSTDDQTDTSRILLGQRFGQLALETSLFGTQLHGDSPLVGSADYTTLSVGVDLKYYVGIVGGLEAYGKIGVNKSWLTGPATGELDYKGRGGELGAGLQFTLQLPSTSVGVWLDYSAQRTQLRDHGPRSGIPLDGDLRMMNLGVLVGF